MLAILPLSGLVYASDAQAANVASSKGHVYEKILNFSKKQMRLDETFYRIIDEEYKLFQHYSDHDFDINTFSYIESYFNEGYYLEELIADTRGYVLLVERLYDFYEFNNILDRPHRHTDITNSEFVLELVKEIDTRIFQSVNLMLSRYEKMHKRISHQLFADSIAIRKTYEIAHKALIERKIAYRNAEKLLSLKIRELKAHVYDIQQVSKN